jgi:hypothetical protein
MFPPDYPRLLNELLEAERAGAKLIAAYLDELSSQSDVWGWLRVIQRDEACNCSVLIDLLEQAGIRPSMAIGEFYRKGLEIQGWEKRLSFLNRGQRWVAKQIAAALPRLPRSVASRALQAMHDSHLVNIAICEAQLGKQRAV